MPARFKRRCVTWSVVLAVVSCARGEAAKHEHAEAAQTQRVGATPELALAYVPGAERTDQAIAAAQIAVREHPEVLDGYVALATSFVRKARETSQNVYRVYADDVIRSARTRGDDRRIRSLAIMLMLDEHRFATAAEAARHLADEAPKDPTGHLLLGDALLELGDYEAATDAYQRAVEVRPDLRSYNRAAHMRWLYGDLRGALQIMDLAIGAGSARDPESTAWCFVDLGTMYMRSGDSRRALAATERALALVDDYVPALALQARALARAGDLEAAIDRLRDVAGVRPTAEDQLLLAELLERTGHADQAQKARSTAELLAEHDPRPLAHQLARHAQEPERALVLARRALEFRHDIATHDTLALALLRNGETELAKAAIDQAMALGTRDPELFLHAAMIHAAAGRRAEAKKDLATAVAIDPGVDPMLASELRRRLQDA